MEIERVQTESNEFRDRYITLEKQYLQLAKETQLVSREKEEIKVCFVCFVCLCICVFCVFCVFVVYCMYVVLYLCLSHFGHQAFLDEAHRKVKLLQAENEENDVCFCFVLFLGPTFPSFPSSFSPSLPPLPFRLHPLLSKNSRHFPFGPKKNMKKQPKHKKKRTPKNISIWFPFSFFSQNFFLETSLTSPLHFLSIYLFLCFFLSNTDRSCCEGWVGDEEPQPAW